MQDLSDISNLIQLPKQRDLTSPETRNKIEYLNMSTGQIQHRSYGTFMGHLQGFLSDSQKTESHSEFCYFLLLTM